MKYKKTLTTIVLVAICCIYSADSALSQTNTNRSSELGLTVSSDKKSYKQGEVVNLFFTLANTSNKILSISDCFGVGTGYLSVHVSEDKTNFQEYNPGWGMLDGNCFNEFKPNDELKASASVLWNRKLETKELNEDVARRAAEGKIHSDYAFPKAGRYWIKTIYNVHLKDQPNAIRIESKPIQITIEGSIGEDLEFWNKIKDNGDIAYFIHKAEVRIPNHKPEERAKFIQFIEQVINEYPNSFYAESLRQNLVKFRANEEKRKAVQEKRKQAN